MNPLKIQINNDYLVKINEDLSEVYPNDVIPQELKEELRIFNKV